MIDPAVLTLLDAALRGGLLVLLPLVSQLLWRDRPALPAARLAVWLAVWMAAGLAVQVVSATPLVEDHLPWLWQMPLIAVSVANAVLFWVFVRALFDDDFRPGRRHAAAWVAVASLTAVNCLIGPPGPAGPAPWASALWGLQRLATAGFAVLAAAAALRHWRNDLVEGRRHLRLFIVSSGVAYTLGMLAARLGSPQGRLSAALATLDVLLLLLMLAVLAWRLLGVGRSDLFPQAALMPSLVLAPQAADAADAALPPADPKPTDALAAALAPPDAAETRLAVSLQRLMAEDRAYRSEDLSLASLAGRLAVPEYRLRRLINQRLGHRNFSAYVNGWRLAEAQASLADPAQRELPVLTIALDAGFQSIGPFNRAFKTATGRTPSEFRREKLADS